MIERRRVCLNTDTPDIMRKIALITDSTVSFTPEQSQALNVEILPLTIVYDNKEYSDQITISNEEVKELLAKKELLQTSQPNLGMMIDFFQELKKADYDYIFILALSSTLSGTYSTMLTAVEQAGLENYSLIDTKTLVGPVQQALKLIIAMNEKDVSIEEILHAVDFLIDDSISFLYPENLETLKRGGRISKQAAMLASLLKIKPLLYLDKTTPSIEKLGTAKTEGKIFQMILEEMENRHFSPETHDLFLLDCDGRDISERFAQLASDYKTTYVELPAILACHAGLKTIAIQLVKKIPSDL